MKPPPIDISPFNWEIVWTILQRHIPEHEVWAFGSRATWTAREYSDLDLAVIGDQPLAFAVRAALVEDLEESDLPFKVDVVDWATTKERFRRIIEKDCVVVQEAKRGKRGRGGEWGECELADACASIDYGLTASAASDESGPKFLRITDIVSGHIEWNTVPHVMADGETVAKYQLRDGDIVLARTGASTGASAYVKDPPRAVFASYLVRLQAKPEFAPRFLAYYLRSNQFWTFIRGVLGDKSAQPNASASTMTKAPLRFPKDGGDQRAIAHILGTLDDKIELNRRMNETLEAQAAALFKSWFVNFDPVRAKAEGRDTGLHKPIADLFPDRLVDSELGEIPEGWEVESLDAIADYQNGLALQKYRPADGENQLPVVKIAQLRSGQPDSGEWATSTIRPECVIDDGDIVFSWSGSLMVKVWCGGRAALNQHLFKVTSTRFPKWFYFHCTLAHLSDFRRIAAGKATTMGHIKRHHLGDAKCIVPSEEFFSAVESTFATFLKRVTNLAVENRILAALRDTLLPKLISGELRVKCVERLRQKVE